MVRWMPAGYCCCGSRCRRPSGRPIPLPRRRLSSSRLGAAIGFGATPSSAAESAGEAVRGEKSGPGKEKKEDGKAGKDNHLQVYDEIQVIDRASDMVGVADSASEGVTGQKELAQRPIARPGELLETVPGVIITQHSGSGKANQYFLRGFNLDHGTDFRITVDDIPVNMPSHAHGQGYTRPQLPDPRAGGHHPLPERGPTTPRRGTSPPPAPPSSPTSIRCPRDRRGHAGRLRLRPPARGRLDDVRRRQSPRARSRSATTTAPGTCPTTTASSTASCATARATPATASPHRHGLRREVELDRPDRRSAPSTRG